MSLSAGSIAALVGLCLCAAGCAEDNPSYRPILATADGGVDLSSPSDHRDLAIAPEADLSPPSACASGERMCEQTGQTADSCVGGAFLPDRNCPIDSTCANGYCQVPPDNGDVQGQDCTSENDCATDQGPSYSCEPFVTDPGAMTVGLACARTVGAGGSADPCQSGADCRSGFCIPSRHTCFRGCTDDSDCPHKGGFHTRCRTVAIRVEGIDFMADSCVAP